MLPIRTINEIFRTIPRKPPTPLPYSLLPLHRTFPSPQPSQNHINRFAPHHILASLVKGEVLSPEKNCATTGGIALHPPTSPSPQPLQNHNRPSPRTTSLPCLPPLHRILLPSHLSFLFNILITANFNFAVYHIDGILSPPLP